MKNHSTSSIAPPPLWKLLGAFAAVYLIWGSTYLAIRYAIESIPPFIMAGTRNLVAGMILYAMARRRQGEAPTRRQWRDAGIAGALMLLIGNGCVTWAEKTIPSGVTALLVALTPVWMALFEWLRPGGARPGPWLILGIAAGFSGVALLARGQQGGGGMLNTWGVTALMVSSIGWSLGSIFNRSADKPASPLLAVGMQMITGGGLLLGVAVAKGEPGQFQLDRMTPISMGSWLYLMVAGSMVAYSAYIWLLQVTSMARVSTNAYVNPLIAVVLGCTIGKEVFSSDLIAASALIIAAVVLIVRGGGQKSRPATAESESRAERIVAK